jgi:hypothetical protein
MLASIYCDTTRSRTVGIFRDAEIKRERTSPQGRGAMLSPSRPPITYKTTMILYLISDSVKTQLKFRLFYKL